jgi:hypothetical protein
MNTLAARFASQLDDALFEILHGCQIVGLPSAGSGKWSATDNLAHLGRYHEVFAERLSRILAEEAPEFARYRADDDEEFAAWRAMPLDAMLERVRALRRTLTTRVEALTTDELDRVGVHPAFGRMRLRLWIEFFLMHEGHHLYVILQRTRGV